MATDVAKPWSVFQQRFGSYKPVGSPTRGQAQAEGWAIALSRRLFGKKATGQQIQFIYDWEIAEGGGGFNNPLNQGAVPGHPHLTLTGSQFGGGAAAYRSESAGLTGAVDYLHMQNYSHILAALKRNDIAGARDALVASPWAAGHYGGSASGLPTTKLPVSVDTGGAVHSKHKPWWDFVVPSTGQAVGRVGKDIGSGASKGAGIFGGITKNVIIIGAVIVLIILLVKK